MAIIILTKFMIYKSKELKSKPSPRQRSNLKAIQIKHSNKKEKIIQKTKAKISSFNRPKSKTQISKTNDANPQKISRNTNKNDNLKTYTYFDSDNSEQKALFKKQQPKYVVSMNDVRSPYFCSDIQEIDNHFILQDSDPFSIKIQEQQNSFAQKQINLIQAESITLKKQQKQEFQFKIMGKLLQKKNRQIENLTSLISQLRHKNQVLKQIYQSFYSWKQIVSLKIKNQLVEIANSFSKQRQQFAQKLKKTLQQHRLKNQQGIFINKGLRQSFLKGIYKINMQALSIIDLIDKDEKKLSQHYNHGLFKSNSLEQIKSIQVRYKNKFLPTIGSHQVRFNTKNIQSIVFSPKNNQKNIVIRSQSSHRTHSKHQNNQYMIFSPKINRKQPKQSHY